MPEQNRHRRAQGSQAHAPGPVVKASILHREYGPHQDDGPATVTILYQERISSRSTPGTHPVEREVPVPAVLVKQRRQMNNIAWQQGQDHKKQQQEEA